MASNFPTPPSAPQWWRPFVNVSSAKNKLATVINTLIPTMSPEDQATFGKFLGIEHATLVPTYPEEVGRPSNVPTQITGDVRNRFLSSERATETLNALEAMKVASKKANMGAGYDFLVRVVQLLQDYGGKGGQGMSRQDFAQLTTAMTSLMDATKGNKDVTPYVDLARAFISPTFTAGALKEGSRSGNRFIYGQRNPRLYG